MGANAIAEAANKILKLERCVFVLNDLGGSDAAYVTLAGVPTVDSLGVLGGSLHSDNEYMETDTFAVTAKRLAAIISGI